MQYISPGVTIQSKKIQNFQDNLLTTPKLQEVWLSA